MPYTKEQIDFMRGGDETGGREEADLVCDSGAALGGRLHINLYPFGCRKDGEERFEDIRRRGHCWASRKREMSGYWGLASSGLQCSGFEGKICA